MALPERLRTLDVSIGAAPGGRLLRQSQFEFHYLCDDPGQPALGLLMPPQRLSYASTALFPVLDQNLPEGYLFLRLRELFPKQTLTALHLLALAGSNGIGRLGFQVPGEAARAMPAPVNRERLLRERYTPELFDELVAAYLCTGAGVAGVQPKVMLPDRATVPVPNVIVKAASPAYPGLAANEYLCLTTAQRAGIASAAVQLSDDGQLLLVDRFDLRPDGTRMGFEDVASLMGLCVRDRLSDRKYRGSYEHVADALKLMRVPQLDLERFFEQLAFTVMVKNGDGHLKNYGVLYDDAQRIRLAPMFDVVTTAVYRYARFDGGPALPDNTLALKLFAGRHARRAYPTTDELLHFGRVVCGVTQPQAALRRIAGAMRSTLAEARRDERIPRDLLASMAEAWAPGLLHAQRPA